MRSGPFTPSPMPVTAPVHSAPSPALPTPAPVTHSAPPTNPPPEGDKFPCPTQGLTPSDVAKGSMKVITYNTETSEVPPRSDVDFVVKEAKNASPRFLRLSMYNIPTTPDLQKKSGIPLAVFSQPLAEVAQGESMVPLLDQGPEGPTRCNRCKAYINPFVQFSHSGNKYSCPFCGCLNDVLPGYYCPLVGTTRQDHAERPELNLGTVDYIVSAPLFKPKPTSAPCYLFLVSTTLQSLNSGFFYSWLQAVERILPALFEESDTRIGFATYDSQITFYNLNASRPEMHVIADTNHPFVAVPECNLFVKYSAAKDNIHALLKSFPLMFSQAQPSTACTGNALKIAAKILSTTNGGKILLFSCNPPDAGSGAPPPKRETNASPDSEAEKNLLKPHTDFYSRLASVCAKHSVSIDLFIAGLGYMDLATINPAARATGGQLYYYPNFTLASSEQLFRELYRNLSRDAGMDALLRMRCSQGLIIEKEYGNCIKFNDTDLTVAQITSDSCFMFEFSYDDTLKEDRGAFFQLAMLYTNLKGQRIIRVLTIYVPVSPVPSKIFKSVDVESTFNVLIRQAIQDGQQDVMPEVRKKLLNKVVKMLVFYKKNVQTQNDKNQLILPDCLKWLPIYTLGFFKSSLGSPAKSASHHNLGDTRTYYISLLNHLSLKDQLFFFYPIGLEIHSLYTNPSLGRLNEETGNFHFPGQIRMSTNSFKSEGIYLVDCLEGLFLWVGQNVSQEILAELLTPEMMDYDPKQTAIIPIQRLETDLSIRLFDILGSNKFQHCISPEIILIKQGGTLEHRLFKCLVEDGIKGSRDVKDMTYGDYLGYLHRSIQSLL
uniref:Protein transport protein SEC24 n=1 Tax=Arcella intermedia TaxID=1963864 RepID=A0A6B2KXK7_9EUKA